MSPKVNDKVLRDEVRSAINLIENKSCRIKIGRMEQKYIFCFEKTVDHDEGHRYLFLMKFLRNSMSKAVDYAIYKVLS